MMFSRLRSSFHSASDELWPFWLTVCVLQFQIIAKVALSIVGGDIQFGADLMQFCAGQGEAAMREAFHDDDSECMLLIDTTNASNFLTELWLQRLCPPFSTILINTHRHHIYLYVDGDVL